MSFNPFSLAGKTILVTGASSGIGRGIAVECSKLGAKLVVSGRNQKELEKTISKLKGTGHLSLAADLSIESDLSELVEKCPKLDGLVNNAGIPKLAPVTFIKRSDLNEKIKILIKKLTNFFREYGLKCVRKKYGLGKYVEIGEKLVPDLQLQATKPKNLIFN